MKAGVMSARKTITVIRTYRPEPEDCTRALELLLKKSSSKKATGPAPEPSGRDGTTIKGDSADVPIVQE
jgi:hypothetical protein